MTVFPGAAVIARRLRARRVRARRSAERDTGGASSMAAMLAGELAHATRRLRSRVTGRRPGPGRG